MSQNDIRQALPLQLKVDFGQINSCFPGPEFAAHTILSERRAKPPINRQPQAQATSRICGRRAPCSAP